jgi:hypothetical protein
VRVCEQCGARNDAHARFCASCKAYLGWDYPTTAVPRASAPTGSWPGAGSPPVPAAAVPSAGAPPERKPGEPVPLPERQEYGVRLDLAAGSPQVLPLGGEQRVELTVRNTGSLVDEFVLGVEPAVGWIRVEPARLSLYPGREQQATVVLAPPAVPAPPAGTLARSALHPHIGATAPGSVTVGAVDGISAYIEPTTVLAKTRGFAQVVLRNDGNRPMPVALFRTDAGPGVRTDVLPDRLQLPAGAQAAATVRLRPARLRWRGDTQPHPYRLRVQPQLGRPLDLDAALVQRPLFARWVLPLLLVLLLTPALVFGGMAVADLVNARLGGGGTEQQDQQPPAGGGDPDQTDGGGQPTDGEPATTENPPPPTTEQPPPEQTTEAPPETGGATT